MKAYITIFMILVSPKVLSLELEALKDMKEKGLISEELYRKKSIELEENQGARRDIASENSDRKVYRFTNPPIDIK